MGPLGFQGLDDCARVTEDPSASFRLIAMKGRSWIIALLMTLLCGSTVATGEASRPEGTLTVAVATFGNERWLPHLYVGAEDVVLEPMYENLLSRDPKTGELIPMLAERWQVTDNGRTWKFHLRKGVQFHGGRGELTAEDVKFTFDRLAIQPNPQERVRIMRDEMGPWLGPWLYEYVPGVAIGSAHAIAGVGPKVGDWPLIPGHMGFHNWEYVARAAAR